MISYPFVVEPPRTQIVIHAVTARLRVTEVASHELRRRYGRSNLSAVRDGVRVLRTIVRERMSGSAGDGWEPDLPPVWLPATPRRVDGFRRPERAVAAEVPEAVL